MPNNMLDMMEDIIEIMLRIEVLLTTGTLKVDPTRDVSIKTNEK